MEFVINNIIGRSHCNMTALRFILLTETLVCSVHETADLTCDLFRRIGIRLDGFSSQLVTSDDAADLRKLNSVLLGHLEDNLGISKFAALIDDQASQLTGLHAEMSASKPHHDFSRALAEKGDLAKNGFLLLGLLPCLLSLVNEDDVMDFIIQKIIVEDGEEYITGLDSDKEFDLVQVYMQRDFFMQLKGKLKSDNESEPDNP